MLEIYGIARPFIVKNLFSIRNDIDHHDATPTPKERCMELLDIVWYFLKATDRCIEERKEYVFFAQTPDDPYLLYFYINYRHEQPFPFWGWFSLDQIFKQPLPHAIPIQVESIHTKNSIEDSGFHKNRKDTDLCIHGYFPIDDVNYPLIVKRCLRGY